MTEQQLQKQLRWCRARYNGLGDDVFQEACLLALERYQTLDNVNSSLFSLLCREAFRNLHTKEIPFTEGGAQSEDSDRLVDFPDPRSMQEFVAIEERDEIEKLYGREFLQALEAYKPNHQSDQPIQLQLF